MKVDKITRRFEHRKDICLSPKSWSLSLKMAIGCLFILLSLFLGFTSNETAAKTEKKQIKYQTKIKKFTPILQRAGSWGLIGDLKKTSALVLTDLGTQRTTFRGRVVFSAAASKSGLNLQLTRLQLAGRGVRTKRGDSGVISLKAISDQTYYRQKGNRLDSTFSADLHYPLIDKYKGYRPGGRQGEKEPEHFLSYVEKARGSLQGNFGSNVEWEPKEGNRIEFNGKIKVELSESILGEIHRIELSFKIILEWRRFPFSTQDYLCIQPVFIGSGAGDPQATGEAFEELMSNSKEIWGKCCIFFWVRDPVYVNNYSYKVISPSDGADPGISPDEAQDLMDEYDDPDCIEVFMAERWGSGGWDGGGATWSSGQAAAQIVTVDEQLDVPCSGARSCRSCGSLNRNHLAHELGHVLNLLHPGDSRSGMETGTAGSVLEPSGWCADNPASQSEDNCNNASNPLIYLSTHFGTCEYDCEIS